MKKRLILIICTTLMLFIITACGSTQGDAGMSVQSTKQATPVESVTIDPTVTPGELPAATVKATTDVKSTSSPMASDPATPIEVLPVKTDLEATDPNSVSLASGQVQLVEFFAFW